MKSDKWELYDAFKVWSKMRGNKFYLKMRCIGGGNENML